MKFQSLEGVQSLAIVGATGLVGREFLTILGEHKVKIPKIKLLASEDSAGELLEVGDTSYFVEKLAQDSFQNVDVAFFSLPGEITEDYAPLAVKSGALVIDDSSLYRMSIHVPLIVPEVNGHLLKNFSGKVIAIPNCTTTPLAVCLNALQPVYGLKRVVVSSYQSVSGAGRDAYDELSEQTIALLNGQAVEPLAFPHRIAFNCIPEIGETAENGNTEEEEKVIRELRKILDLPRLPISATAVRVPTFFGHGLSVNIEFENEFPSVEAVREALSLAEGIRILDRTESHIYPTNVECIGDDAVLVGRIRQDHSVPSGINLWIMADNLRKGAALNALQCLELLYRYRRMS